MKAFAAVQRAIRVRGLIPEPSAFAAGLFLMAMVTSVGLYAFLTSTGLMPRGDLQDLAARNLPPGSTARGVLHLLGTDQLGRDELARLLTGATVSLTVGIATAVVAVSIGTLIGLLAGFYRGALDDALMRIVDIQMSFPPLLLALAVLYIAGTGFLNVILVIALVRWTTTSRVTRGLVLGLRERQFVESARAIGCTNARIILRHMLPNTIAPILVLAQLEFAHAVLAEAALSFLGMGVQPPDASWGLMLSQSRSYMTTAWWLVALPGTAIVATTFSVNVVASWVRVVADPTQRWRWMNT